MITYTNSIILLLGFIGILLHVLKDINKINHQENASANIKKYFKVEWAAILISAILVIATTILKREVSEFENLGMYMGGVTMMIGYTANSLLAGFESKANKFIETKINN